MESVVDEEIKLCFTKMRVLMLSCRWRKVREFQFWKAEPYCNQICVSWGLVLAGTGGCCQRLRLEVVRQILLWVHRWETVGFTWVWPTKKAVDVRVKRGVSVRGFLDDLKAREQILRTKTNRSGCFWPGGTLPLLIIGNVIMGESLNHLGLGLLINICANENAWCEYYL